MQTLGLASEQRPTDGMLKRLFWPSIENQYDVDLVGQQGFWVCVIVAVLSTVMLVVTGQAIVGSLVGLTYLLAGMGVRERSVAAAVLIFLCYFVDRVGSFVLGMGGGNPLLGAVALMLLFANVRATILSRRWRAADTPAEVAEIPERTTSSFGDKLSNQMPTAVWPKGRFVFYPLAGLLLLLTVAGMVMLQVMPHRRVAQQPQGQQIEVAPAQQ
jgi:hypothetical protein